MDSSNSWFNSTSGFITTDITNATISSLNGVHTHIGDVTNGSYITGGSYSYDTVMDNTPDFSEKALDLEKMNTYSDNKRNMIFDIFMKYIDCTGYQEKKLLYNTLEQYNVIVDVKILSRKAKISSLLKDNK